MFLVLALVLSVTFAQGSSQPPPSAQCKYFPGDRGWPSAAEWNSLNRTVRGRLIQTIPLGSPCHEPHFDAAQCQDLRDKWLTTDLHFNSSSSTMMSFFANQSCDPFQSKEAPCTLGNYVWYTVNASGPADVQAAITFARKKNVRFVIRNTGHDFLGRSIGAGALSVWTHHLKNITFIDAWKDPHYSGPAVRLGAGVQGYEIMAAARDRGRVVLSGECPTVGVAGGYTQGGGHSAISSIYGLSADNVLSWEVVTADGRHINASKTENSDLYWALAGGGGGNYAVVISMTVKTYPDAIVSGSVLTFTTADNSLDAFNAAVDVFHQALPNIVDTGIMISYYVTDSIFTFGPGLTAYNKTQTQLETILNPLLSQLDALSVKHTVSFTQFSTYYEHYYTYEGTPPFGNIPTPNTDQYGGRLIPRSIVPNITSTIRQVTALGGAWIGLALDVSRFGTTETNAVNPAWRTALISTILRMPWNINGSWAENLAVQDVLADEIQPLVDAATPGSGAYVNEGNFRQRNFQQAFWGTNYERLLRIKRKWDPSNFLYATVAVGSEAWTVQPDGRMCRA